MTLSYFGHRNIDSELNSLKRNLQMKRAMGYGLTQRDIAQLHQLQQLSNARQDELNRMNRVAAEKRKREAAAAAARASFPKKLTVDDVQTIFRMFAKSEQNHMNGTEFCSLVASLLHVRNGVKPTDEQTMSVAEMLARNLVYQHRWGSRRDGISLPDFINNAIHGDLGRLISEAHRASKDVVGTLKYVQIATSPLEKMMVNKEIEQENENNDSSDNEDDVTDDEEDSSSHSVEGVTSLSANEEQFHDCNTEIEETEQTVKKPVSEPELESETESETESDSDNDDVSESEVEKEESNTSAKHSFQLGEMLIFRRPQDDSCRTVKVVELLDSGLYAVEHEVETTANHITLVEEEESSSTIPGRETIKKGSQVIYKKEFNARVLEVGSAYTFDEEGRPSYLIAVKTITDASRLSKESI